MRYGIKRIVLGGSPFIEISESEYNQLLAEISSVVEIYGLEQKYDILLNNFIEFEIVLAELAVRHMTFFAIDYQKVQIDMSNVNRMLMNLLSSCRMYIDHVKQHCNRINNYNEVFRGVKELFSYEYDNSIEYEAVEYLRNYSQHRGFPVNSITYGANRDQAEGDAEQMCFSVSPFIDSTQLSDPDKQNKIDKIVTCLGSKIDIKYIVRRYIESVSRVHTQIRSMYEEYFKKCEDDIMSNLQRYVACEAMDGGKHGIALVIDNGGNTYDILGYFNEDVVSYINMLKKKNSRVGKLSKRYVRTG